MKKKRQKADSLESQTPAYGREGLISILDNHEQLIKALMLENSSYQIINLLGSKKQAKGSRFKLTDSFT